MILFHWIDRTNVVVQVYSLKTATEDETFVMIHVVMQCDE